MAGGKETPRQKMIGMMYLVLTALLALNVSKTILDAFVAIEENIQIANENEWQRGDEKLAELEESAQDNSVPETQAKAKKLLKTIEKIDKMTAERIREIDALKMEILEACGEDTKSVGSAESILVAKSSDNPLKPIRMRLEHVQNKEAYDEPMRILIGEDITRPTGKGMTLWNHYNDYRSQLTELVAGSNPSDGGRYFFKAPKINSFKDQKDLSAQIAKAIKASNVHPDDQEAIKKIYVGLTKRERVEAQEIKNVHWIGKTFDHAPSVAVLASLSSMQKEILTARADAVSLIRQRVGGGEYSFNKIIPLAYGPEIANAGEEVEVQVLMAAYDSDRKPTITVNGGTLRETKEGKGYITARGSGNEMNLSGTIMITNKSGIPKTLNWQKKIKIMKPQGTVSLPKMNMLYRNYNNIVEGVASGYDQTILTGEGVTLTKSGNQFIGRISGSGRTATIRVSGKNNATGKTESLGSYTFRVSNLPPPSAYLGNLANGSTVDRSNLSTIKSVFARYSPEIPLDASFEVASWDITISGVPGMKSGQGSTLSTEAKNFIAQARSGSTINVLVKYKGSIGGFTSTVIKVR
ncbi:MAG TPA: GldM family protein [Fluviicola sp.]|nr:GldM family protein [Fluviicola sp.]